MRGIVHILSEREYPPLPDVRRRLTKARACRDSAVRAGDSCIPQGRTLEITFHLKALLQMIRWISLLALLSAPCS